MSAGKAVGARPGRDQVIGGGLRGRIRRTWIVGRLLDECAILAERAVNFVGRHMQEAEAVPPRLRQRPPIGSRRLQQGKRADNVGLDESVPGHDRAVDVTFGGEMDHLVGSEIRERLSHGAPVANVDLGETIVGRIVDRRKRLQVPGVGERVDVEHRSALGDQAPAQSRADEPCAAGHKHFALHEVSRVDRRALCDRLERSTVPAISEQGGRSRRRPTGASPAA